MATHTDVGVVEKTILKKMYEEVHIEWRIPNFSIITEIKDIDTRYNSPVFFINEVSWFFRLFPRSSMNSDFMRLYINRNVEQDYSVDYSFGLKKSDGSGEQLINGIVEKNKVWGDVPEFIKRSELLQRKSELLSQNVFTITCLLKYEVILSTQPTTSDKVISLNLIRLDKLSENFKDLFSDNESCDVSLKVKDKEYKAHRSVLIARSSVFAANFKHDTLERQTDVITIPDCDPDSFQEFLEYLYCGKLDQLSLNSALNLYYTSDKYNVEELKSFCVEYLMQCLTVENICEIVVLADKYEETALFSAVQEFFNTNLRKILVTEEWECLLKRDYRLVNKLMIEMSKMKFKE